MTPPGPPFLRLPTSGHLRHALLLSAAVSVWFGLVYGGADWLAHHHCYRVRLHFDAELRVPFVPAAVVGYMSVYLLFIMAPFVLRTGRELTALVVGLTVEIGVAGIGFLLLPADNLFPTPGEMGGWSPLVWFAQWLALDYNFAPSLHVAMGTLCAAAYARQAPPLYRAALWLWAGMIGLSTLLLHQHYIIDIVTGYLLAFVVFRCVYERLLRTPPASPSTYPAPSA
jgi:membrane-associated phospholipid phosphatase